MKQACNFFTIYLLTLDLVHDLAVGDEPVTVFLESLWHRVESPEELRGIRLDDSR